MSEQPGPGPKAIRSSSVGLAAAQHSFEQSVDDYIESFHSRNGFSRERMSPEQADAFDEEARKILLGTQSDGVMTMQVVGKVVWGIAKD
jgi:hypothetical protein